METTDKSYVTIDHRDKNLCRVCLSVDKENQCIFYFDNNHQRDIYNINELLWEKLQLYGGIEISQNDDFPEIMCNNCISKMNIAHEFRMQCQASDKILRSMIYTEAVDKNEQSTECWLKIFKDDNQRLHATGNENLKFDEFHNNRKMIKSKNIFSKEKIESSNKDISQSRTIIKTNVNKCKDNVKKIDVMETLDKSKKHEYRSQRMILFKRATSLTNLKNNKERQRQYMKKSFHSSTENVQNTRSSTLSHKCSSFWKSSNETSLDDNNYSCDKIIRLQDSLEHEKISNDHDKTLPTCKICNKIFRKTVTMVRHLNVHKRDNPRAVYFILRDMRDKRRRKNAISLEKECTKAKNIEDPIVDHRDKRDIVSTDKLICNGCSTKFLTNDELSNHRDNCISRENNVNREDDSPPDDRSAIKMINMWIKEELNSDNEGKGFSCENCGKSYSTSKSLSKHREKMHADIEYLVVAEDKVSEEKSFTCEECDKIFLKESKLKKHLRIHARAKEQQDTDFKRFLCHICSKTFRQNTGLMFHMRTHTGYKPHVCKYCGRGFTSNSNCINHERTHTGDRPFVCHFCSAAFAKSCTLKAHITTHTGEANYHCKTCDKSFRRLKYLKEHRFTHTGEKPYACKICGTAYSHSGSLFVHEKKCKAQEGNYQLPILDNNRHDNSIVINNIPQYNGLINNHLDIGKCYIENGQRFDNNLRQNETDITTICSSTDILETPSSSVRNFTVIGQMFNT